MRLMKNDRSAFFRKASVLGSLLLLLNAPRPLRAQLTPGALASFNEYSRGLESRLAREHQSAGAFLAAVSSDPAGERTRLRRGELMIEQLTPSGGGALPGALLHDWRGTAFAAGATADDFERLLRDYKHYPEYFAPQVLQARVVSQSPDKAQAWIWIRVRQKHVLSVVLDATDDVTFGQLDPRHGYSISRSERITEVDGAGTAAERTLDAAQEHGFLWRLNTYWSYEEGDGGLYLQIEAVSLTRSIPHGLGWVVGPYVESIPRDSLEFTLRSACDALRKH
jgi:hypothetical protein